MGVVIGAPILAMATVRLPRKATLLGLMVMFVLGNTLCALASSYSLLMAARIITALCHGAFFGIGSVVAADLVPRAQRARAIALMFAGLTLADVLGVPLGTALGQAFSWRATFWAVTAIGLVALAGIALLLPAKIRMMPANLTREIAVLGKSQVLLAMAISALVSASLFTVFTYITPMLEDVTGVSPHGVSIVLLLFGVGLTLGNVVGGRLADWKLMPSLIAILLALILVMGLLFYRDPLAARGHRDDHPLGRRPLRPGARAAAPGRGQGPACPQTWPRRSTRAPSISAMRPAPGSAAS